MTRITHYFVEGEEVSVEVYDKYLHDSNNLKSLSITYEKEKTVDELKQEIAELKEQLQKEREKVESLEMDKKVSESINDFLEKQKNDENGDKSPWVTPSQPYPWIYPSNPFPPTIEWPYKITCADWTVRPENLPRYNVSYTTEVKSVQ